MYIKQANIQEGLCTGPFAEIFFLFFRGFKSFVINSDKKTIHNEELGILCPRGTKFEAINTFNSFELRW